MDKALKMGQASATGSFQLFIGKIVSTVILAVGTIILGIFIHEGEYGLYAIALIPATTILLFQDWGIASAMTKYCAQYRALNKQGDLRRIIVSGLTFEVATGLALTVLSLLMANFIASTVFGKPESAFLMTLASITILSTSLFMASQSIFVGFERMKLSSYTMICQATVQCVLSPLLVYLGYGALGAILGYTFSILVTGIIAVTLLYFAIFRKLDASNTNTSNASQTLKPLLRYGIPLAIAAILGGILPQFYSFVMASFVDVAIIGNYRIATNFAILLTFFTIPISTVLFPAFSKLDPRNEQQLLKTIFTSSVKYTALFLVPATMALLVLSQPMISTIYGDKWLYAPFFLTLGVIGNLFAIFGNLSMGSLLSGLGETKMLMKLNILTLGIGIPLALLLIPPLGIPGVIVVTIVAGVPSMFISLYWTWKRYGTKVDFRASAKIFLASTIAAITTYLFLNVFTAAAWITFTTGVILFLAIYLIATPLIGAINQTDVNNLRAMFSGLGIISKLLEIPLTLVEKLLKTRTQQVELKKQQD
ncbi:oligosaccharide flippase family protein [Candidatus Bathyarchaeota archaeon]|nr:oligosaccharide flippase family protein [Candidatus Bathyarchaeota archaeon]